MCQFFFILLFVQLVSKKLNKNTPIEESVFFLCNGREESVLPSQIHKGWEGDMICSNTYRPFLQNGGWKLKQLNSKLRMKFIPEPKISTLYWGNLTKFHFSRCCSSRWNVILNLKKLQTFVWLGVYAVPLAIQTSVNMNNFRPLFLRQFKLYWLEIFSTYYLNYNTSCYEEYFSKW